MQVPEVKIPHANEAVIDELKKLNSHVAAMRTRMDLMTDLLRSLLDKK